MSGQMFKVEIVTRPAKFETLKQELGKIGVTSLTFSNVHGCGLQKPTPNCTAESKLKAMCMNG